MSIIKHEDQRVAVFIDTQNLYHTARHIYDSYVNFKPIIEDTVRNRKLIRATAYMVTAETNDDEAFFEALTKLGIETKTKDLQVFAGGAKKADWDVGLAIDAVTQAAKVDAVIIVSGDGDFSSLVTYLKIRYGIQVEVAAFGQSTSHLLKDVADDFLDLAENPKRYVMRSKSFSKKKRVNQAKKKVIKKAVEKPRITISKAVK